MNPLIVSPMVNPQKTCLDLPKLFPANGWYDLSNVAHQNILRSFYIDVHKDNVLCPCCGTGYLMHETVWMFRSMRDAAGVPIHIGAGARCPHHQATLVAAGARAAKDHPPHVYCTALDCDIPAGFTQEGFAKLALKVTHGQVRVGYKAYAGQGFDHIDQAFRLKPVPDPANFIAGTTW